MSTYARITQAGDFDQLVNLSPEQFAALQANGKAQWLRAWSVDAQPAVDPATQAVADAGIVIDATTARQTWAVRAKTQEELDRDDNQSDKSTLTAAVALLKEAATRTTPNSLSKAQYETLIAADPATLTTAQRLLALEFESRLALKVALYFARSLRAGGML